MAGENWSSGQYLPMEESMLMLFGEELRGFDGDNFEGSMEEHRIFSEIFYGKKSCNASKRCTRSCEPDERKHPKAFFNLNCESSVLTSQTSTKDLFGKEHRQEYSNSQKINGEVSGSKHIQESFSSLISFDAHDVNAKRLKLSSDGLSNYRIKGDCLSDISQDFLPLDPLKEASTMQMPDFNHIARKMPCRIVESFGQGIISSSFLPSHHEKMNGPVDGDDNPALRTNSINEFIGDGKGAGEGKSIVSPFSQESLASKLGDGTSLMNPKSEEFSLFGSDAIDGLMIQEFIRDLPIRLRSHAHHLLVDAGWAIEERSRKGRIKLDSVFKTPGEGFIMFSLSGAWKACGERLFANGFTSRQEENLRQWVDINAFWHDLSVVLAHTEKEIRRAENCLSLLDRWQLLDPFVAVVCIDKKICYLREGKGLKYVSGKISGLDMKKGITLTAKISDGVENQAVKSTSCSMDRSNQNLLPARKSSATCTSLGVLLNRPPLVDVSVSAVIEPPAIESPCNQKVDRGSSPISAICVAHDLKPKHGVNRKFFRGNEVGRRSLKSLARSIGNGSHVTRGFHGMKRTVSAGSTRQRAAPSCIPKSAKKCSTLSKADCLPANIYLPQGSIIPHSETSTSKELKPFTVAFPKKSINCTVEEKKVPFDLKEKLLMVDQQYEQMTINQQMPVLHTKDKIIFHGRSESCKDRMPVHENTLDATKEVIQLGRSDSSVSWGIGDREASYLDTDDKIGGAKKCLAHQEKTNIQVLEEGSKERMQENVVTSKDNGKLFLVNQMHDYQLEEQKILFLYPREGNLCFGLDGNCRQQLLAFDGPLNAANGDTTQQEVKSRVYQANLIKGVFVFNMDNSVLHSMEFSPYPVHRADPSVSQPENNKEEIGSALLSLKSGPDSPSGMPTTKKTRKRSKKISEIAATKLHGQDMKTGLPGENYRGVCCLDADNKKSDIHDFPLCQEKANLLDRESIPEGSEQFNYQEEKNVSALKALEIVDSASTVQENCLTANKHKKSEKSGTKVTKLNRKPQEVESESILLNEERDQEDIAQCKSQGKKHHEKSITRKMSTSTNSFQHQCSRGPKTKKLQTQGKDFKEPVIMAGNGQSPLKFQCNYDSNEASPLVDDKPLELHASQKIAKKSKSELQKENGLKRLHGSLIDDDDLLIAAIIKNKDFSSDSKHSLCKAGRSQKGRRKLKSQKGSCNLLLRTPGKGGKHSMDGKRIFSGARTALSWLIYSGVLSLNDVVQYHSPKNNAVIKDGRVTRDGILCKCCTKIFSISEFKFHAGYKIQRPSLNLFLQSGKSYTLCQLQAWSDEYKFRKGRRQVVEVEEVDQNDDTCGLCGDGGDLVCCDNCPSTFHQSCLPVQELPEGSWYCPNCTCKVCGDAEVKEPLSSSIMLECSQCEHKYHEMCAREKGVSHGELGSDTWFCGGNCQEVYFGLRSRIGVVNPIADGFSWTVLKCGHGDQKIHSAQKIALMAECNTKLAIALSIMEECFLPMVDPRTGIDMIPQVLYNWGSKFARLNYQGFYTVILEKDGEVISVASIRVHGITVAEMPLIATCSEHRRQGMCRRLMNAIEEMLKSFKVDMLVLSAIPDLVDTWTSGFGFKSIDDDEKRRLSDINMMVFPGTTLLKKSLHKALETNEPGENNVLSPREDLPHKMDFHDQRIDPETLQQPDGNSCIGGIGKKVQASLPVCMNLQVKEHEDPQERNLLASSSRKPLSAFGNSDSGKGIVAEFCNAEAGTSNVNEMDLCFSTQKAVTVERATAHCSSALGPCSVFSSSPSSVFESSTDPSTTGTCGEINAGEDGRSGHIGSLNSVTDVFRNKQRTSHDSQGGKVGDRCTIETSECKNDCIISRGMFNEDTLNLNKLSFVKVDSDGTSVVGSSKLKERLGTSVGSMLVSKLKESGKFGTETVDSKKECNSSILARIDQNTDPSEPALELPRIHLDQVGTAPVSEVASRCKGISHTRVEGNLEEKDSVHGTGLNGACESLEVTDFIQGKRGDSLQGVAKVNDAEAVNLLQRAVCYGAQMGSEGQKTPLNKVHLFFRGDYVKDQTPGEDKLEFEIALTETGYQSSSPKGTIKMFRYEDKPHL